jgi:hypothetical protein
MMASSLEVIGHHRSISRRKEMESQSYITSVEGGSFRGHVIICAVVRI